MRYLIAPALLMLLLFICMVSATGIPPHANAGPDQTVIEGEKVYLNGTGTDEDGKIVLYKWDFDGDGNYDWQSTSSGCATHVYLVPGIYNATLMVVDNESLYAVDVCVITVKAKNHAPYANAGGDVIGVIGVPAHFNGSGYDPDGKITKYEWDFNGDGIYDWESDKTGEANWTYHKAGTYTAILRVTDDGTPPLTDTASCKVMIYPANKKPKADAGEDIVAEVEEKVKFHGTGSDPDGKIVKYEWDFDGDGKYDWEGKTGDVSWIYHTPGVYYAVLRVTDDGVVPASDTDKIKVTIQKKNIKPIVVTYPNYTFVAGEKVVIRAYAEDPDGKIVSYKWDLDGDRVIDMNTSYGEVSWKYENAGRYTAMVEVEDDRGATSSFTFEVLVENKKGGEEMMPPAIMYALFLLIGMGAGASTGAAFMYLYAKKHWEKFFKPTDKQRLRMEAELELEEQKASSFRGLPPYRY